MKRISNSTGYQARTRPGLEVVKGHLCAAALGQFQQKSDSAAESSSAPPSLNANQFDETGRVHAPLVAATQDRRVSLARPTPRPNSSGGSAVETFL